MNILQFFHRKEELPMFSIGDQVRLKSGKAFDDVRKIYNKHYPNCACDSETWYKETSHLREFLGTSSHIVTKVIPGTPAAGGWFVYVDGNNEFTQGYHGNIFELA